MLRYTFYLLNRVTRNHGHAFIYAKAGTRTTEKSKAEVIAWLDKNYPPHKCFDGQTRKRYKVTFHRPSTI